MRLIKLFSLLIFLLFVFGGQATADNMYWVGGAGDWSDLNHWATTSGGSNIYTHIPTSSDSVIIDAGSGGTTAGFTITIPTAVTEPACKTLLIDAASNCTQLTFTNGSTPTFTITESVNIQKAPFKINYIYYSGTFKFLFTSNSVGNVINFGPGTSFIGNNYSTYQFVFDSSSGGSWKLQNNIISSLTSTYNAGRITSFAVNNAADVDLNGYDITLSGGVNVASTALFRFAGTNIRCTSFTNANTIGTDDSEGSTITGDGNFNTTSGSYFDHVLSLSGNITNGNFKYLRMTGPIGTIVNTVSDTLWLNPVSSANYTFATTGSTVNDSLHIEAQNCGGLINLTGISSGVTSLTIENPTTRATCIKNISATNFVITGPKPPMPIVGYDAENSIDNGGNSGLNFLPGTGKNLYWIGGTGNWEDPNRWATTSGGAPGSGCIPTPFDTVYFDGNSGLGSGTTITMPQYAYCHHIIWNNNGSGTTDGTTWVLNNITATQFYFNIYNYYSELGAITGRGADLDRSNYGRFIYEKDDETIPAGGIINLQPSHSPTSGDQHMLVGNPFMAHLDFGKFVTQNAGLIEDEYKLAYGINPTTDGALADLISYQNVGGQYVNNDPDDGSDRTLIPPMQSFIVTSTTTSTPALTVNIQDTQTLPGNTLRNFTPKNLPQLGITSVSKQQKSKAVLVHYPEASNSYRSEEDSRKLFPGDTIASTLVYLLSADDYALDINSINDLSDPVRLGIRTIQKGKITLSFSGTETFAGQGLYLHDIKENRIIDLTEQNEYSFLQLEDKTYLNDRFFLRFETMTSIENPVKSEILISSPAENTIRVYSTQAFQSVEILDLDGRILQKDSNLSSSTQDYTVYKAGIYLVKITGEQFSEIKKIRVK